MVRTRESKIFNVKPELTLAIKLAATFAITYYSMMFLYQVMTVVMYHYSLDSYYLGSGGERDRTWQTVEEMVDDPTVFDTLRIADDFHNLKAAIKQLCTGSRLPPERLYVQGGRLDPEKVRRAVNAKDFAQLPGRMNAAGQSAYETLVQTADGQLCDVILDRAALEDMLDEGAASGSEVLNDYASVTVIVSPTFLERMIST